jgi:hypothetical protein
MRNKPLYGSGYHHLGNAIRKDARLQVDDRNILALIIKSAMLKDTSWYHSISRYSKAGISPLTISRVEQGKPCRIETQRKILLALGLKPSDKNGLFGN